MNTGMEKTRMSMFENLTAVFPDERIVLERGNGSSEDLTGRIIDLIAPIGKGQRSLVVASPEADKALVLQGMAQSIVANHPDMVVIVLLIDEPPEEVAKVQRSVPGEVVVSAFGEPPARHIQVAEMVMEKAKRLVEDRKDVVIVLDSITRLARAYNGTPSSGEAAADVVDADALERSKRFFGAARSMEEGGSLTIIAAVLIDTGADIDEEICREFKGSGNQELHLERKLAERGVHPAINIRHSGTRREDLLMGEEELQRLRNLRKLLHEMDDIAAIEFLINKLKNTKTNDEFLSSKHSTSQSWAEQRKKEDMSSIHLSPSLERLEEDDDDQVRFTVFAPSFETGELEALCRQAAPGRFAVRTAATLEEALENDDSVLVTHLTHLVWRSNSLEFNDATVAKLRDRKIVAIGASADHLFECLNIPLCGCIHAHAYESIDTCGTETERLKLRSTPVESVAGVSVCGKPHDIGLYAPKNGETAQHVEVLARNVEESNYAVIARYGNHVLVGTTADIPKWTDEYKRFIVDLLSTSQRAKHVPFSRPEWKSFSPGTYTSELAEWHNADESSSVEYRFKLTAPGPVTMHVRHSGSSCMALIFMGLDEKGERIHWMRKDARNGEELEIAIDISDEDIRRIESGFWEVMICNFDASARANYELELVY